MGAMNLEGGLDGSVGEYLALDRLDGRVDSVGRLAVVLVDVVRALRIRRLALALARWRRIQIAIARLEVRAVRVVFARRERIWTTPAWCRVVAAGHDAVAHPVLECGQRFTSFASATWRIGKLC